MKALGLRKKIVSPFPTDPSLYPKFKSLPNAVLCCPVLQLYTYHQSLQHTPMINLLIRSQLFLIAF